jgi:hypothetical protein
VLQHHHRVGVEEGGPHQAFHVGRVAGIHHFDAANGEQGAFDGARVVGPAAAVGPDGHPDEGLHRELAHGEVAGFRQLLDQLVQGRPDVVGKLDFDDGLGAHGRHAGRAAHDVSLLNGRVEHPAVAVLLGQQGRLAEHAAQLAAHVLPVEQGFGKLAQDVVDGVQGRIYHQRLLGTGGAALPGFLQSRWRGKLVVGEGGRVGVGRGQGLLPVGQYRGAGLGGQGRPAPSPLRPVKQALVQLAAGGPAAGGRPGCRRGTTRGARRWCGGPAAGIWRGPGPGRAGPARARTRR